jgi:hypothetical protein
MRSIAMRDRFTLSTRARLAIVAAAALAAAPLTGCATEPAGAHDTGELAMQLTQPGPHGEIYHLASATFDVLHLESNVTTTVAGGDSSPQVTVVQPPGLVSVTLRDGWRLEKSVDGGATFQPVSALLGSPNPGFVRILANQPSFIEFAFVIRQVNGTLGIRLGIVDHPRELAGGIVIDTATDALAAYATGGNRTLDFGVFFNLLSIERIKLDDGTKQLVYTAFGQQGSVLPVPQPTAAVAAEFYNDSVGALAGPIAKGMAGAFLTYTVAARPDGTVQLTGSLFGTSTDLEFGPSAIDASTPPLDADGFPVDQAFYDSEIRFTLSSFDAAARGSLAGILRVRHLLETP